MSQWQPPEESVAALVAKHTPRQLAIAYLRAQRRFRQTDLAYRTLVDLDDATDAIRGSDGDAVLAKLDETLRRLRNPIGG